jgi:hypothetical protein
MKSLITFLGCGRIEQVLSRSTVHFLVTKYQDINDKIIPFFDKYSVEGMKILDYNDFKKVAVLMSKKVHLTKQGLSDIELIKSTMNSLKRSV